MPPGTIIVNLHYRYMRIVAAIAKDQIAAWMDVDVVGDEATQALAYFGLHLAIYGPMLAPEIVFSATVPEGKALVYRPASLHDIT